MDRRNFIGQVSAAGAAATLAGAAAAQGARAPAVRETVVEAVQMPVWIERGGDRQPVAPGDRVSTADELRTGAGAALVMRLPEGSLVRLGEKSRLQVQSLETSRSDGRVAVRSELKLLDGFFRFATSAVAKAVGDRTINVTLRTATIGIRGTDFWSMTDEEHDAACIFQGRIDLATRDQGALVLDQPTAFWARFFQRPVQPVGNATPQQLATFLQSTEFTPGRGIAMVGGEWQLRLLATPDSRAALRVGGQARAEGYPARVRATGGGHEAFIAGLASRADAEAVLGRLGALEGVRGQVLPAR
jgi:hypothetical protein